MGWPWYRVAAGGTRGSAGLQRDAPFVVNPDAATSVAKATAVSKSARARKKLAAVSAVISSKLSSAASAHALVVLCFRVEPYNSLMRSASSAFKAAIASDLACSLSAATFPATFHYISLLFHQYFICISLYFISIPLYFICISQYFIVFH